MKFEITDTFAKETLFTVVRGSDEFVMNVFNLCMVELLDVYGGSFIKETTTKEGDVIVVKYSHNIEARILP